MPAILTLAIVGLAAAGALINARSGPVASYGPGQAITWQSPGKIPAWARAIVNEHSTEANYQIQVALTDLNRDQSLDLLIAPAARRYDVFVPDTPLRVLTQQSGQWTLSQSSVHCRPAQYGSFVTQEFWDLPCRSGADQVILRWNGLRYTL